ncbi:AlkA N-terminal domain-containing protein [Streptomyces sp. NPDC001922]|uniref:AlkA N-terminal domain-containing protein n=1 Tax=Streptomyces sp. NPDC001922 TaxID=3364624 RepID=UPI0036A676D0
MTDDEDTRYEAVRSRDARFDGEFFFAVVTTGIYCRPSCPAVTPKRQNVRFHPTAASAQRSGYRACRRCRPDAVPGSAAWNARADLVGRAVRLIGDGVVDREGVAGLAARLGYSARQLQRQLTAELGAGPIALARAQRAHTARVLLQTTGLPVTDVAFASGFASVRQFNDTVREIYAASPSGLRAASGSGARRAAGPAPGRRPTAGPHRPSTGGGPAAGTDAHTAAADRVARLGIPLRLTHRGPYAVREIFDFLAARAVPGVEEVSGDPGDRVYRRTLALPHGTGVAAVRERTGAGSVRNGGGSGRTGAGQAGRGAADRPSGDGGWLECRLHLTDLRDLTTAVQRLRRLFDLDADPYAVAERLGADPALAPLVLARPGLRSPGTTDPHELAVRAVLGETLGALPLGRIPGTSGGGGAAGAAAGASPDRGTPADPETASGRGTARGPATSSDPGAARDGEAARDPGAAHDGGPARDSGAVRAVAAALVAAHGQPLPAPDGTLTHLFPAADRLAEAPLDDLDLPEPRRRTLLGLVAALADGTLRLDAGADRDAAERGLLALPGMAPATAAVIRMRALGDPDVLPLAAAGTPGVPAAEHWRPWRSYAHHLLTATAATETAAPTTEPATPATESATATTEKATATTQTAAPTTDKDATTMENTAP